jgi:hypothetical protein
VIDPLSLPYTISSQAYINRGMTFYQACADVVAKRLTLAIDVPWFGIATSATCAASIQGGFPNGLIQPASGKIVTISGTITAPPVQIFDTSLGGAGSILLTGKIPQVYPNWFGAKMDGSTDDTAAWQGTIASLLGPGQTGGTVAMPGNAVSATTTGIVITTTNSQFLDIAGQGKSSVIQCTGVTCVTWNGTAAQKSGMSDLTISDPTGNSATIGLYLNGGSDGSQNRLAFSNMEILGNAALVSGGHFAGLGTGVSLYNITLPRFQNVFVGYFNTDVLQTGFVNSLWIQSYMYGAGSRGWDIEATGDNYALQTDFEGNTGTGIYLGTDAQSTVVGQSHFEANTGNDFEVAGASAQLASSGSNYSGGTALVDSAGGVFLSTGMDSLQITLTNNSLGGGSHLTGATIENPLLGPTVAGTGCTLLTEKGTKIASAGCSGLTYVLSGFSGGYSVDGNFAAGGNVSAAGTNVNGGLVTGAGFVTQGTTLGLNGSFSTCGSPLPTITGTATAGVFIVGSGITTCTVRVNLPVSTGPNNNWICTASDLTVGTPLAGYGAGGNDFCGIKGTVAAGDFIGFSAVAF